MKTTITLCEDCLPMAEDNSKKYLGAHMRMVGQERSNDLARCRYCGRSALRNSQEYYKVTLFRRDDPEGGSDKMLLKRIEALEERVKWLERRI